MPCQAVAGEVTQEREREGERGREGGERRETPADTHPARFNEHARKRGLEALAVCDERLGRVVVQHDDVRPRRGLQGSERV